VVLFKKGRARSQKPKGRAIFNGPSPKETT